MTERDDDLGLLRLDREPTSRTTVDVRRAMTDGRRRRRLRRAFTYAGAGGMCLAVVAGGTLAVPALRTDQPGRSASGPAAGPRASAGAEPTASPSSRPGTAPSVAAAPPPPTRCAISALPVPDGVTMALVTGADPTGRILLGRSYPRNGEYQVLVWTAGRATKVPMRGADQTLQDVTTGGLAVGAAHQRLAPGDAGSGPVPYAYSDGRLTRLRGVTFGSPRAVNEAGKIVGVGESLRPLVWASPASEATELPLPAGASGGEAHDVDEDGTVVGTVVTDGRRAERPYVWFPDGSHRELPLPKVDGATGARAFTVRNGWATGALTGGGAGAASAVRWNVRTGEARLFPAFATRASTANVHGWQVGTDRQGRGLFLSDAGPVTLPDLAKHEPGALTNIAETVSDDGRTIGGQADDASGTIRAVVWRCT
ncbi:hypothetical protein ACN26Y_01660 [Micromonospora sp. WMMD558]|uniref:hypothetical protein n=1 Tax=unclassified Micromonospora TaxID=2617518 RepID=UPI0012B4B240|nr:hypothetical protein [Micromonospora sp. WMMC415]QGN50376.1 hypothetical protein GKC29_28500 [Micromonospora sp. WMMC415]